MADPNSNAADVDDVEEQQNLSKESKQLDKVTDFVEEEAMDSSKAEAALNKLTHNIESEEQKRLAAELAAVVVKQEDIEMFAKEFEISEEEAEKKIRHARGDVKLAITTAIEA